MKNIVNDYCIRMFVGNDEYRPAMMKVSFQNGFLYATNGYMIGKINADLCIHKYEYVEKFPDCESIISAHVSVEKKTFNVEHLFNELMKIECCFKPKMIKCDECNGDGTLICDHCDSEYECKNCNGSGKIKGTELELSGEYNCTIFGMKYKLQYLDLIIRTAVYTGVKEIEISNPDGLKGSVFTVGDFTILLMPTLYNN
jgi:hypothetical protein